MPFERLMERVATLSDEDENLPMGRLAERWGEPVLRIADAIDAVQVLRMDAQRDQEGRAACPLTRARTPYRDATCWVKDLQLHPALTV